MSEVPAKYEAQEIVAQPQQSALQLMAGMAQNGITPEQIEKMMELNERNERNEARKAFYQAMSEFKANVPTIVKDKAVAFGGTAYKHSSLAHVLRIVNPVLAQNDLYVSWKKDQGQGGITVTCILSHKLGHSEVTSLTAPPDDSGKKNKIQSIGSTVKYLERYTLFALLGLADQDDEDDGRGSEPISFLENKKLHEIMDLINAKIADPNDYLSYCQRTHRVGASFDEIPERAYNAIKTELANMEDKS